MAAKTADPQPNIAPLIALGSFPAACVAIYFGFPGFAVFLIMLIVAAWRATAPVMTGLKEKSGMVNPSGPAEEVAMLRFRMWSSLKWGFIMPSKAWFPIWFEKRDKPHPLISMINSPLLKFVGNWHLDGLLGQFTFWVAAGLAVIAAALPAAGQPEFPMNGYGRALNAIGIYIAVLGYANALRNYSAPDDRAPATSVTHLIAAIRGEERPKAIATMIGAGIAAFVTSLAFQVVATKLDLRPLIAPVELWQVSLALSLTVAGAILHAAYRTAALAEWRELVAARAEWKPRWTSSEMKLDAGPRMLAHKTHGDLAIVDTFEASAAAGAAAALFKLAPLLNIQMGSGRRMAMLNEPDVDASGQPMPGTAHPLRFRIVTWPTGELPSLATSDADSDLVDLALESAMNWVTDEAKLGRPILIQKKNIAASVVSTEDEEDEDWEDDEDLEAVGKPDEEPKALAPIPGAWETQWAFPDTPGGLNGIRSASNAIAAQLGVEVIVDPSQGAMYIGALTEGAPEFTDRDLAKRFRQMAIETRWSARWADILKQAARQPHVQHEVYMEARLPIGAGGSRRATLYCQPFVVPQGVSIMEFIQPAVRMEPALSTTLTAAPFVSVTGMNGIQNVKAGGRHQQAIAVYWSPDELPSTPDLVQPSENNKAASWLLAGLINRAFDVSKLSRPELINAVPMTDKTSKGHIWKMQIKLYGGVTIAEVRTQAQKIRQALNSQWLRVADGGDGVVVLVAGADPSNPGFVFARSNTKKLSNQDYITSLDWEQAFLVTKVIGDGGAVPKLLRTGVLPRNEAVQVIDFSLPAPLTRSRLKEAVGGLMTATKNAFIDVRAGTDGADSVRALVSKTHPLPDSAPVDWDEVLGAYGIMPFATGVEGNAVFYDPRVDAHILIAGASGGGKSVSLQVILYPAAMQGCEIYVVDPTKGGADFGFVRPYAKAFAATIEEADALMKHVYGEVMKRKALNAQHRVGSYRDLPEDIRPKHIYLVMDEFTSLMQPDPVSKTVSEDPDVEDDRQAQLRANAAKARIGTLTGKIAREARSAGVTLVLATQKLSAKMLDTIPGAGDLKTNLSRMLMGNATFGEKQSALKNAIDAPPLGDHVPRGRGLWETSAGIAEIIQVWFEADQAVFAKHLAEHREPLPDDELVDLAALVPKAPESSAEFRDLSDGDAAARPNPFAAKPAADVIEDLGEIEVDIDFDAMLAAAQQRHDEGESAGEAVADAFGSFLDASAVGDTAGIDRAVEDLREHDVDPYAELLAAAAAEQAVIDEAEARDFELSAPLSILDNEHSSSAIVIDIDGVLAPVSTVAGDPAWGEWKALNVSGIGQIAVSPEMIVAVAHARARIVWGTDWSDSANDTFAYALGRGELPVLRSGDGDDHGLWKIGALEAYVTSNPGITKLVWIDDLIDDEDPTGLTWGELAADILEMSGVTMLQIVPDKGIGITRAHWATIEAFLAEAAGDSDELDWDAPAEPFTAAPGEVSAVAVDTILPPLPEIVVEPLEVGPFPAEEDTFVLATAPLAVEEAGAPAPVAPAAPEQAEPPVPAPAAPAAEDDFDQEFTTPTSKRIAGPSDWD
jgi:S-DNA-T family DNA segregation ATPase FtsK/SpoIIIE